MFKDGVFAAAQRVVDATLMEARRRVRQLSVTLDDLEEKLEDLRRAAAKRISDHRSRS